MLSRSSTPLKRTAFKPKPSKLRLAPMKRGTKKLRHVRKVEIGSEAWMKQLLTIAFSKFIRKRDRFCFCGAEATQAGHYFHRDMPSVEFDPENVIGICERCNYNHEFDPAPMTRAMVERLGEERMEELRVRSWDHIKLTFMEVEALLELYTERA